MTATPIDDSLRADCHVLGTLDHASVLLNRNAAVGWLILVVDTSAVDWHELDDTEHARVSNQVRALTGFAAHWFAADKMNVATLGNQVSQMHLHIIARHRDDDCWPRPVWGHLQTTREYTSAQIDELTQALTTTLGLNAGSDT